TKMLVHIANRKKGRVTTGAQRFFYTLYVSNFDQIVMVNDSSVDIACQANCAGETTPFPGADTEG
ncbi:MAG: hypothetical protein KAR73_10875, partial [Spirochaetales bacterium]|nr:hypothetical protein [Spirochaetales bacterium]